LTKKSPQPYLLNHADLHVHAAYDAFLQNLANLYIHTRSFKADNDCAQPRQVVVRIVSRLRCCVPLWWVRCHNLPHTWLCPLSHHCYGTHWLSAIRISRMAKVSVSFGGYLHNTYLRLIYNPPISLNTQITHVICNHRAFNTCNTRRWIPWI